MEVTHFEVLEDGVSVDILEELRQQGCRQRGIPCPDFSLQTRTLVDEFLCVCALKLDDKGNLMEGVIRRVGSKPIGYANQHLVGSITVVNVIICFCLFLTVFIIICFILFLVRIDFRIFLVNVINI